MAETQTFYLADDRLRAAGFVIRTRPPGQSPVWRRNGCDYLQCVAEKIAAKEARERVEDERASVGQRMGS